LDAFLSELVGVFPSEQQNSFFIRGMVSTHNGSVSISINNKIFSNFNYIFFQIKPYGFESKGKNLLKYIIVTKLGSGPKCVDDHLLNCDGTLKPKIN